MAIAAVDASGFTRQPPGSGHPLFWGFLGLVAIETTVFTSLVVTYFYLRMTAPSWPPEPLEPPDLALPTINTIVFVASSFVIHWADRNVRRDQLRRLALGLTGGVVLALIFLALKVYEYGVEVSYNWYEHAYGSIVWTIIGFHSAHVVALVLKTIVIATLAWKDYFHAERRLAVTVNGIYWHFVVIVWIPLYFVLYWAPRLL